MIHKNILLISSSYIISLASQSTNLFTSRNNLQVGRERESQRMSKIKLRKILVLHMNKVFIYELSYILVFMLG